MTVRRGHTSRRTASVLVVALLAALALAAAPAAARTTLGNWDAGAQRAVVGAGVMANLSGGFHGERSLSAPQANRALAALAGRLGLSGTVTVRDPVRVVDFDRAVVVQLGLGSTAAFVQSQTARAGLRPPAYYGSEVIARFLGLRYDHPAGTDALELFPTNTITRAEAAWSFVQVLDARSWAVSYAEQTFAAYALPAMDGAQREALRIAVSRIGYPYVWGGTTDDTSDGLAHGGFDCSGFVWRVFKLSGLPWGRLIGGRTAAQMAGEIPRSQRLRMRALRPGDILFFGSATFTARATESNVDHAGIYLGNNWVINSSGQGVYVLPLAGSWLGDSFAWGRRVLP
jgi:cell wall-associated NlpC family hydrolase